MTSKEFEKLEKEIKNEVASITSITNNVIQELPLGITREARSVVDESESNIIDLLDEYKKVVVNKRD